MQAVLKDALKRAASGGSSTMGDGGRDDYREYKSRSSLEGKPRSSADSGSCLAAAGQGQAA